MVRRGLTYLLGFMALQGGVAHADFPAAMADFTAGRYEQAHAQFLTLAALGDAASQFNLGAMALQGQGGPRDMASAVGWLTAAATNGGRRLAPEKLAELRAKLTDEERTTAERIARRYGRAGLEQTVLPIPPPGAYCRNLTPARLTQEATVDDSYYPRGGRFSDQNGFVIVQLTVGTDGTPRDPEVLMAVPGPQFSAATVDYWMRAHYAPATQEGAAVESRTTVKTVFHMSDGGVLWEVPSLKALRATALTGDPRAQYQIGLAATLDPTLGIPAAQAFNLLVSAAQGGHPQAQYWVANRFMSVGNCGADPRKLPWLRAAAAAGDGAAQLALAQSLIGGQPTAEQISEARGLLTQAAQSDNFYVMKHVAALLASSSIEALRNAPLAKVVAAHLLKDPIDTDPQKYEVAALAYALNRDFWMAAAKEQAAIKVGTKLKWNTEVMQQRLALYHKSQLWSGDVLAPPPALATAAATAR